MENFKKKRKKDIIEDGENYYCFDGKGGTSKRQRERLEIREVELNRKNFKKKKSFKFQILELTLWFIQIYSL